MPLRDADDRYGGVTKLMHWSTVAAVAATVPLAFVMQDLPAGLDKFRAYGWHKSIGIAILTVTLVRLAWRLATPRPAPVEGPAWQARAAAVAHALLYACLLALPILGWLHSAAANTPVSVFGLFVLPQPIAPDRALVEPLGEAHALVAWLLLAVIAVHVLAAFKHHLVDRDRTLLRMMPLAAPGGGPGHAVPEDGEDRDGR